MKCQRPHCGGTLVREAGEVVCLSCGRAPGESERGGSVSWVFCVDCGRAFPTPGERDIHEAQHELRAKNGGHPTRQARARVVSSRPTDISRTW